MTIINVVNRTDNSRVISVAQMIDIQRMADLIDAVFHIQTAGAVRISLVSDGKADHKELTDTHGENALRNHTGVRAGDQKERNKDECQFISLNLLLLIHRIHDHLQLSFQDENMSGIISGETD
jgi:hypothetical protein